MSEKSEKDFNEEIGGSCFMESRIPFYTKSGTIKLLSNISGSGIHHRPELLTEYMFVDQAAQYLGTTTRKISLFRRYGLLKAGKLGKNYVYKRSWLDEFMNEWAGYDLSSEGAINLSIKEKRLNEKKEGVHKR